MVVIRKLQQKDFVPRGLFIRALDGDEHTKEEAAQYLKEHPEDTLSVELNVILRGVVEPRMVEGIGIDGALGVEEISQADRNALFMAITEFSEMTVEAAASVDKFRRKDVDAPGANVAVLPGAADGAAGADGVGVQAGVPDVEAARA